MAHVAVLLLVAGHELLQSLPGLQPGLAARLLQLWALLHVIEVRWLLLCRTSPAHISKRYSERSKEVQPSSKTATPSGRTCREAEADPRSLSAEEVCRRFTARQSWSSVCTWMARQGKAGQDRSQTVLRALSPTGTSIFPQPAACSPQFFLGALEASNKIWESTGSTLACHVSFQGPLTKQVCTAVCSACISMLCVSLIDPHNSASARRSSFMECRNLAGPFLPAREKGWASSCVTPWSIDRPC